MTRIRLAFNEFGGAFLCDSVGSGKTYIALAVAREMKHPLIIAPAALREMWRAAIDAAECKATFTTVEALSYRCDGFEDCDGIIVDEAHHFRNANTRRYRGLSSLARRRRVLLMTATPIHNSRRDFENLAALFLGSRASHLSAAEVTRVIIRRGKERIRLRMPEVTSTEWLDVGDDPPVVDGLLALPPPVPLCDAGEAATLLANGLIRQWASSEAALDSALKRRRARAAALESALEAGEYPTPNELRGWICGEDAVQLQLHNLFAPAAVGDRAAILEAVRVHSAALASLSRTIPDSRSLDDERSRLLRQIRLAHPDARVVAFASYEATVVALFERLLHSDRVACLTSHGARVAGGRIARAEAIGQFDPASPSPRESDRIGLLLTTDLLSEGVNLQAASVVVHLDMPWTAARLEQRVGRVARAGSRYRNVAVFGFRPPPSAERALRATAIVTSKWSASSASIGVDHDPGLTEERQTGSTPEIGEALRAILTHWLMPPKKFVDAPMVAAVESDRGGFLALIGHGTRAFLMCDTNEGSLDPSHLLDTASRAGGRDAPLENTVREETLARIERWMATKASSDAAGISDAAFLRTRRRIFARLDSIAAAAAPHSRFRQGRIIERVRGVAGLTLSAEDERALNELSGAADLPSAERWLAQNPIIAQPARETGTYKLRALLILVPSPAPSS